MNTIASIPVTVTHTPITEPAHPNRIEISVAQEIHWLTGNEPATPYLSGEAFSFYVDPEVAERISKGQQVTLVITDSPAEHFPLDSNHLAVTEQNIRDVFTAVNQLQTNRTTLEKVLADLRQVLEYHESQQRGTDG